MKNIRLYDDGENLRLSYFLDGFLSWDGIDEKEMDKILDDEKNKLETSERMIDEIEKEFGDHESKKDEIGSVKSTSRPATATKSIKNDQSKSSKSINIFEEDKDEPV